MTIFVNSLTKRPRVIAAKMVPRPTPTKSWNTRYDMMNAEATKTMSNTHMTLSNLILVTWCMARTSPSSASIETLASTSSTIPNPMMAVLRTTSTHCSRRAVTTHGSTSISTRSTNMLNMRVNGSWLRVMRMRLRSLIRAHSRMMHMEYTMNSVIPKDSPVAWLTTFGSDAIGDAPWTALTDRTTPTDMTRSETIISNRSFLKVGREVTDRRRLSDIAILSFSQSILRWIRRLTSISSVVHPRNGPAGNDGSFCVLSILRIGLKR